MRDRARAGWDRVRIAVSELFWRRFRRVFRKKRRAVVEGPILACQWSWWVLYCGWRERAQWREREKTRREETAEQTAAELAVRQQEMMQTRQQQNAAADTATT